MKIEKLQDIKLNLKKIAPKDLELCFVELLKIIDNKPKIVNEVLSLQRRFNSLNNEVRKGTIESDQKNLESNKLFDATLSLIDNIEDDDLVIKSSSKNELVQSSEEVSTLQNYISVLKEKLIVKDNKIKELESMLNKVQIKKEKKTPESLEKIQIFYQNFKDLIEYYPRFNQVVSTQVNESFHDNKVSEDIVNYFTKKTMRHLYYFSDFLNLIIKEKDGIINQQTSFPTIENFDKRFNELIFFRKTMSTDTTTKQIGIQEKKVRKLSEEIQLLGE